MSKKLKPNKGFSLIEISIVILIIAILVYGISTGIDLYKDAKISTAKNLTTKSPVSRISELSLWLEASDSQKIECYGATKTCTNNGKIKIWFDINPTTIDKINVGRNNNGDGAPTYVEDGINGLPSINFNQDNYQYLSNKEVANSSPPPIIKNKPDYTMIAVWRPIKKSSYNNDNFPQHLISQGSAYSFSCNAGNCGITGSIVYKPSNNLGFFGYHSIWGANIVKPESVVNASIMIIEADASNSSNSKISLYNNSLTAISGTFPKTLIGICEFNIGIFACRKYSNYDPTRFHGLISEQKWSIPLE